MPIAAAIPYVVGAASVASSIYTANQTSKAADKAVQAQRSGLDAQKSLVESLKYAPIDIEKLKRDASAQAVQNATQSLAMERSLRPDVASAREELSRQVNEQLAMGGNLPPDVANRVTRDARTIDARSGAQGNAAPVTASLIGLTSLDLMRQRQQAAAGLLAANPLQPAGLDPGAVASAEVAQNAAMNQFNLEKAGVSSNLINSTMGVADAEAKARAAEIGGQTGIVSALSGFLGNTNLFREEPTNYGSLLSKIKKPVTTSTSMSPSLRGAGLLT